MLQIDNWKVYDLKESVIACRNAMRLTPPEYTEDEFEKSLPRAIQLAKCGGVSGHSNFRKGIRVSFDMRYTQYITKQLQRYHWFDYISSSSLMHRLTAMDVDKNCAKYVTQESVDRLQEHIDQYNWFKETKKENFTFVLRNGEHIHANTHKDVMYYQYMRCIQNCPMGYELFVRVSTNYEQLATIYHQRKHHKLKEDYGTLISFIESLPYANEFIIGNNSNN